MSALFEVRVPADQSEGTRSQVLKWLKAIGAAVTINEALRIEPVHRDVHVGA